jgi:hypothetical protein
VIGSPAIAAWIAHIAFWCLLAFGWAAGELDGRGRALFVAVWVAGFLALRHLAYGALFPSFVAVLDVALVLAVFKSDIRIT